MTADDARARAIEAIVRELGAWDDLAKAMRLIPSDVAAAVLDAVAPIFEAEADRRVDRIILMGEGIADRRVDRARGDLLADLRVKVEGLGSPRRVEVDDLGAVVSVPVDHLVWRSDVLALLGEVQP